MGFDGVVNICGSVKRNNRMEGAQTEFNLRGPTIVVPGKETAKKDEGKRLPCRAERILLSTVTARMLHAPDQRILPHTK